MKVLAIDPGPKQSAFVIWDGERLLDKSKAENWFLLDCLTIGGRFRIPPSVCIIEQIKSYGMPVSDSIFDTIFWTGRFCEAWGKKGFFDRMPRMTVKMHLCHNSRARDSNIRQALIDRFGPPGTKKNPGLTYGLKADLWAAFSIAVTWFDIESGPIMEDINEQAVTA